MNEYKAPQPRKFTPSQETQHREHEARIDYVAEHRASIKNIYPDNWKELSLRIRIERAQGQCECTGECNGHAGRCQRRQGDPTTNPKYTVMLTVAHLDAAGGPCRCKEETGEKCGIEEHLKAMCNRCHLVYDMPHHIRNAKATRTAKKDAARPLLLNLEG